MPSPEPSPLIQALVSGSTGDRVRVRLDDGSELDVPPETRKRLDLSVGSPVDERLRAQLQEASLEIKARERSLRLLSHRDRSRGELMGRLRQDGIPGPVITGVMDELEERGLVNDARFARNLVRERVIRKPRSQTALLAELRKRSVASSVARAAVDEILEDEGVSERSLALEAARGWLRRQGHEVRKALNAESFSDERERAVRRLAGYLGRRGFRGSLLYDTVQAVTKEVEE